MAAVPQPLDPKDVLYNPCSWADRTGPTAGVASAVLVLVTIYVLLDAWRKKRVVALYVLIGVWAVLPPLWFWFEYFFVYREHGRPGTLELYKAGQDVSRAIWAGVLAALIAFAASDAAKPKKDEPKALQDELKALHERVEKLEQKKK